MRSLRGLIALLLAMFALAGCVKIDMNLTIDSKQDTVSGSIVFAIDKAVLTMGGKTPEEGFPKNYSELDQLPKGTRSEIYDDGKYYGRKLIFENTPFAEFNRNEAGAPVFTHANGRYTFTMDANPANLEGDANPFGEMIKSFLDAILIKVAVTFPGRVIERDNLAQLEGNTVTWDLKFSSAHKLKAVSEEPAQFQWLLVAGVGGLFGLLVIIGIVVLAIRLNRRPRPAAEPMPTAYQGGID